MSSGLYSGVSGLALGAGLYRSVSGLWGGASGLINGFGGGFSPAALFASGEPGGWYDIDPAYLYQDSAGTTPVTAPGQTVGMVLDRSKGLVLGPELVTAGWSLDAGWSQSSQTFTATNAAVNTGVRLAGLGVAGRWYRITITWSGANGAWRFYGDRFATLGDFSTASGTITAYWLSTGGTTELRGLTGSQSGTFNISVRELPGNHLTQSTLSNRAIYGIEPFGGRRNLLTYTEQFDNAAWTKNNVTVTPNNATAPDGTMTADTVTSTGTYPYCNQQISASVNNTVSGSFSIRKTTGVANGSLPTTSIEFRSTVILAEYGLVLDTNNGVVIASSGWGTAPALNFSMQSDGDYWRVSYSSPAAPSGTTAAHIYIGCSGGFLNGTRSTTTFPVNSVIVWGAQLELGSTATAYQRVTDQWNVTEAGKTSVGYLQFDGSDDWLVSPTITPGIDKAQVFAGVRKLSDAAQGLLAELSATSASNNGTFTFLAPDTPNDYAWASRGTTRAFPTANGFDAPITNVVTGLGDIAADMAIIRVNGVQAASSALDQGTGNYLAYPLYVGRRGGTSLPYNGRIYSLIVRFGANLDAATITQTENWVAGKTGIYTVDQLNRLNARTADGTLYSAYAAADASSNNYLVTNSVRAADGTSYNVI